VGERQVVTLVVCLGTNNVASLRVSDEHKVGETCSVECRGSVTSSLSDHCIAHTCTMQQALCGCECWTLLLARPSQAK
jgi:hypothetical protein